MLIPNIPHPRFESIKRLSRGMVITEKIDGSNALVYVDDHGLVYAGSRNRWLTVEQDNFGFARWVSENEDQLRELGPGLHYGEWWGLGIQRGYGLTEKRFSLFNVGRWNPENVPACCHVVPVLYEGLFDTRTATRVLHELGEGGSVAAPGFSNPEGIVVFHEHSRTLFKKTLDDNDQHKFRGS